MLTDRTPDDLNFHLYYRLPWAGAAVGKRTEARYQILRSDTEKIVAYGDTEEEAVAYIRRFDELCQSNPVADYSR